jgi:hypothetical protein
MGFNYCVIGINKMYEEIYDLLDDNDLHMGIEDENDEIFRQIHKFIEKYSIFWSETYTDKNIMFDDVIHSIAKDDSKNKVNANTIILCSNEKYTYEMIYTEYTDNDQNDDNLNHFASFSNLNLTPISGKCAIIKTKHMKNVISNELINSQDIYDIVINNFYHTGVMIDGDNLLEIQYSGEHPFSKIGNNFQNYTTHDMFGFRFICYFDNVENNKENKISEIMCNKQIKTRTFVCLLGFEKNKKMWNVSNKLINEIVKIKSNEITSEKLNNDVMNSPNENYFLILSKYFS